MLADKKVVASAVNIRGNQEKMKARAQQTPSATYKAVLVHEHWQFQPHRHASPCWRLSVQAPAIYNFCLLP